MKDDIRPDGLKFDSVSGVLFATRGRIKADPKQPRKHFNAAGLKALRASIDELRAVGGGLGKTGIDFPLSCRWDVNTLDAQGQPTRKSELIIEDGERRLRATDNTFPLLPLIIKNDTSEESWDVALRSSFQKQLLTPMEEGDALVAYMKRTGHGIHRTAKFFGLGEGYVKNRVYLHDCPADVQDMVNQYPDTMSHALAFRAAGDKLPAADRKHLVQKVLSGMPIVALKEEIDTTIQTQQRKKDTRRAPDTHTQQRITTANASGSAPVSRGKQVKGASVSQSITEAVNGLKTASVQIDNAASWFRTIDEKSYINRVVPELEKLIAKLEVFVR